MVNDVYAIVHVLMALYTLVKWSVWPIYKSKQDLCFSMANVEWNLKLQEMVAIT